MPGRPGPGPRGDDDERAGAARIDARLCARCLERGIVARAIVLAACARVWPS